ncbi:MAG: hypothetical protein Q8S18_13510 [Bacteroidales bacterium]|nr:hypothetical protein [Bacteroidales bacterium]
MKRAFLLFIMFFFGFQGNLSAQSPEKFNYQAVARDASGNVLVSQAVTFRISILQTTSDGTAVYVETHSTTTNAFGQVSLTIGGGTPVSGTFSSIGWGSDQYFLKTEMDAAGGTAYTHMGTTQLLSVPYALYAKASGSGIQLSDADGDTKVQVEETADEDIIRFDVKGNEKLKIENRGIVLSSTTDSLTGVIYKGTQPFIHNYSWPSNDGGNTFIGVGSGNFTMMSIFSHEASHNTGVGVNSLNSITTGYHNSANGYNSLQSNTSGAGNTANGS